MKTMKRLIITILAAAVLAGCASAPVHNRIDDEALGCTDLKAEYTKMEELKKSGDGRSFLSYIPILNMAGLAIDSQNGKAAYVAEQRAKTLHSLYKKKGCDKQPK
jgi:Prokaryotic membrane lipoprotein lipid attachment site